MPIIGNRHFTSLTLFGSYENHTVCSSRSVDGTRCSILQHVDTLDVGRVQVVDVTASHTIDNIKRLGITIGTSTTDGNLKTITRLTRYCLNAHTGALALESAKHLSRVQFGNIFTFHLDSSTSDQLLLLDTITDDNHFFKNGVVIFHRDVESRLVANGNLLCLETDKRHNDRCTRLHIK